MRVYTPIVMSDAKPSSVDPCYCGLVRRASRSLTELYELELAPHGLTLPQYQLLRSASAHGPVAVNELAEKMGIDRTTLARNTKLLIGAGLINLVSNPDDQRERLVLV